MIPGAEPGFGGWETKVGPCPRMRIDRPPYLTGLFPVVQVYPQCTGTLIERVWGQFRVVFCTECDPH